MEDIENPKVKLGLEAQGCIPIIEKILSEIGSSYYAWETIGRQIGWEPLTACSAYYKYLLKKKEEEKTAEIIEELESLIKNSNGVFMEYWPELIKDRINQLKNPGDI